MRLNSAGNIGGFRAVANIDYLSSFLFRLAFNEVFSQAVYSEVKSQAFLSKSADGFSLNGFVERYQNFLSTTPGQVVTISHAPSFDFSSVDRQSGAHATLLVVRRIGGRPVAQRAPAVLDLKLDSVLHAAFSDRESARAIRPEPGDFLAVAVPRMVFASGADVA